MGPTEIRVVICAVLLSEVLFAGSIQYLVIIICVILFIINCVDTKKLLDMGDERDWEEKKNKEVPVNEEEA